MNPLQPKDGILELHPYVPGKATAEGFAVPTKLSANENAFGCPASAKAAFVAAAEKLNLYPDPRATGLRTAIAERFGLEPERLIFGCGSDELFTIACQTFLNDGDTITQPAHGFAAWAIAATAAGGKVVSAPERDGVVDVDALLAKVDERTRIVFVANPANPTGTYISTSEVRRLHAGLPASVMLLYDGAYAEFAAPFDDYDDGLEWARTAKNVFVTRTFSKIYGLATLRVGWGYADAEVIAAMDRIRLPFNISTPGLAAAQAALDDEDFVTRSVEHVRRWTPVFEQRLAGIGLRPLRSATNFVTVAFPDVPGRTATDVEAHLASLGILVRGLKNYGLTDCLRITIGLDEQNERVLDAIDAFLGNG
jgi:histidinol-phosphate aminotransferase